MSADAAFPPELLADDDGGLINMEYIEKHQAPFNEHALIRNDRANSFPSDHGGPVRSNPGALDFLTNNNTGSNGTGGFTQSETSLVAFGNTVVVAFNDSGSHNTDNNKFTGFTRSTDGGSTFTDGGTLPTNANGDAGDPVLARNEATGRIYFSTLVWSGTGLDVFHSDDNGITWSAPAQGAPGKGSSQDKQWIAVDNFASAGNGNVYLIERDFGSGNGIYFFRSTDNGATFGPSGGTLITSGYQGAFVTVGPDHSVYAFWYAGSTIQMRKSTDQGVTFAPAVTVASNLVGGSNGDLGLTGIRNGTSTASGFRSSEFPHAVVNPVNGNIYVTYANKGLATGDKGDVFLVQSTTPGGSTFSAPVKVNDDATTTDQWQPTLAVSPDGSRLGIFYYSRQEDPTGNNLFKYYGRIASISGPTVTFTPSFAISTVASLPEFGRDSLINSVYMGDYNQAVATPGYFHVSWSDNRNPLAGGGTRMDPNVYYDRIALGLVVASSTPAAGTIVGTQPTDFVINFSDAVDPMSVQVTDFTFTTAGGTPVSPNSYVLSNANTTITFTYTSTPVTAQGVQNMAIAAGAIKRASDGSGIFAFNASFRWDAVPLTVSSTSPASGSTIALSGSSSTEYTFVVGFSDDNPIDASTVGLNDLTLNVGTVSSASKTVGFNEVTYKITGLTAEGTLSITLPAGSLTDGYGNPNVAYSTSYVLDFGTVAFPVPLQSKGPLGSLVYDSIASGFINPATDSDSFTLSVDAGQTITVVVHPDPSSTLQPTIMLSGPLSGIATAAAAGQEAVLQPVGPTLGGAYTVTVSGAAGIGQYTVQVILNAAVESESHNGSSNNTVGIAENIDASFTPLLKGATRGAVLGQGDDAGVNAAPTPLDNFDDGNLVEYTFLGTNNASATTAAKHDGAYGLQAANVTDWMYRNDAAAQVSRGDLISVWVHTSTALPIAIAASPSGATESGTTVTIKTTTNHGFAAGQTVIVSGVGVAGYNGNFTIASVPTTTTFTYTASASGLAASGGGTSTIAPDGRAYFGFGATPAGTLSMVMAPNTNQLVLQRNTGYGFEVIGAVAQTWLPNTWYQFQVNWKPNGDIVGTLLGSDGTTVLNTVNGHDDTVFGGGIAFRSISNFSTTKFFDTVQVAKFTPNPDFYAFSVAAGERVTLAVKGLSPGNVDLALVNLAGTVLATGTAGQTNVDKMIYNWGPLAVGTYYARVTKVTGAYDLVVTRNAVFDREANDTFAAAQDITGVMGSLSYIDATTNTLTLNATDSGWWNQKGTHNSSNKNYIAGLYSRTDYHNYFVFDFSAVAQPILTAQIRLTNPSNTGSETYALFDVSTSIATLMGSGSGQTGIFNDLGAGTSYGSRAVTSADNNTVLAFNLNSSGISYLNAAKGSQAAVGGAVTTLSGQKDQDVFGYTGNSTDVKQLVLTLGPPEDWYKVTLGAGVTTLHVDTSTPGDGPGEFINTLNPHIELYSPANVLLYTGITLLDGRNEVIDASGLTPGATYRIRVMAEGSTRGEYFLDPPITASNTLTFSAAPMGIDPAGNGVASVRTTGVSSLAVRSGVFPAAEVPDARLVLAPPSLAKIPSAPSGLAQGTRTAERNLSPLPDVLQRSVFSTDVYRSVEVPRDDRPSVTFLQRRPAHLPAEPEVAPTTPSTAAANPGQVARPAAVPARTAFDACFADLRWLTQNAEFLVASLPALEHRPDALAVLGALAVLTYGSRTMERDEAETERRRQGRI